MVKIAQLPCKTHPQAIHCNRLPPARRALPSTSLSHCLSQDFKENVKHKSTMFRILLVCCLIGLQACNSLPGCPDYQLGTQFVAHCLVCQPVTGKKWGRKIASRLHICQYAPQHSTVIAMAVVYFVLNIFLWNFCIARLKSKWYPSFYLLPISFPIYHIYLCDIFF